MITIFFDNKEAKLNNQFEINASEWTLIVCIIELSSSRLEVDRNKQNKLRIIFFVEYQNSNT